MAARAAIFHPPSSILGPAEVAHHRRGQRAHADLDGDKVGPGLAAPRQLVVDLAEDRRITVDHPARHLLVAGPGRVGDHQAALAGHLGRARHRVVVGAVDDR